MAKKKEKKAKPVLTGFAPGSYGCHEALHVALMLSEMIDQYLTNHPAIQINRQWRDKADDAAGALVELYQMIGAEHL